MALQTKTYSEGSFDRYNGTSNGYILDLILTEESVDRFANTSLVSYKLQLRSGSSNQFNWEFTGAVSLNGRQVATKTAEKNLEYNSTWIFLTGQETIVHDDDGTLNMSYSATLTPWNGGNSYTPPKLTVSGKMKLTEIARESTVAATAAYIGDAATVAVSRKSTAYTHSIRYQFGDLSGYIADSAGALSSTEQKLTETTIVLPIPESFYAQIPDAPSGACTLTCKTYSGTTQIGDSKTAKFTITADPARCSPIVSGTVADINDKTLALTGSSKILIQGKSVAQCAVTAQAQHSATIKDLYVNGVKIESSPYDIRNVTTASITFRAVDSRGYPTEYAVPGLTLVPYVPLSFFVEASRTDPTSGNGQLKATGKWYNGSFGDVSNQLSARYCVDGGSWVSCAPVYSGGDILTQLAITRLDYRSGHSIDVEMSDRLDTVVKTATVSKGIPVFDWGENDFCFHVPVTFIATDGTEFTLDLVNGQLKAIT